MRGMSIVEDEDWWKESEKKKRRMKREKKRWPWLGLESGEDGCIKVGVVMRENEGRLRRACITALHESHFSLSTRKCVNCLIKVFQRTPNLKSRSSAL
jgi:hypothetical protein